MGIGSYAHSFELRTEKIADSLRQQMEFETEQRTRAAAYGHADISGQIQAEVSRLLKGELDSHDLEMQRLWDAFEGLSRTHSGHEAPPLYAVTPTMSSNSSTGRQVSLATGHPVAPNAMRGLKNGAPVTNRGFSPHRGAGKPCQS